MVLSFRGPIGCGKTTALRHFQKHFGFVPVSFANPLKLEVFDALWKGDDALTQFALATHDPIVSFGRTNMLPQPDEQFRGRDLYYVTPEEKVAWVNSNKEFLGPLLQWWGTEYRRSQYDRYWIEKFLNVVSEVQRDGKSVVIDDCRFGNEIDEVLALGGKHVYIVNPHASELAAARNGSENRNMNHASERENNPLDPRNWTILGNFGTLHDFKRLLHGLAYALLDLEHARL